MGGVELHCGDYSRSVSRNSTTLYLTGSPGTKSIHCVDVATRREDSGIRDRNHTSETKIRFPRSLVKSAFLPRSVNSTSTGVPLGYLGCLELEQGALFRMLSYITNDAFHSAEWNSSRHCRCLPHCAPSAPEIPKAITAPFKLGTLTPAVGCATDLLGPAALADLSRSVSCGFSTTTSPSFHPPNNLVQGHTLKAGRPYQNSTREPAARRTDVWTIPFYHEGPHKIRPFPESSPFHSARLTHKTGASAACSCAAHQGTARMSGRESQPLARVGT